MAEPDVLAGYLGQRPFVTREWLAELVEERLRDPLCRHVLLTADAGMGKSSFLAWLTTRFPLAPYYFVRLDSLTPLGSADATHLLMSVGHQLAAACPEVMASQPLRIDVDQRAGRVGAGGSVVGLRATRLVTNPFRTTAITVRQRSGGGAGARVGVEVDELVDSEWLLDVPTLQRLALLDPAAELARRRPDARIVLLVDGLDELRHQPPSPRWTIVDWLEHCPDLPPNVRVLASSRPDPGLLRVYRLRQRPRLREVAVLPGHDRVRRDLDRFVAVLVADDELAGALRRRGVDLTGLAAAAAVRAHGNFLYLVSWARAVRFAATGGGPWDERLVRGAVLPTDLTELHELFVAMIATAPTWESAHRPVLAALTVARAPLTTVQLATMAGVDRGTAGSVLADLPHVLRTDGDRCRLFHLSFAEYLQSEAARAALPEFWIDPAVTHRQTAERLVAEHGDTWSDEYAAANVVAHLVAALVGDQPDADHEWSAHTLAGLLGDDRFVTRSREVTGVARTLVSFAEAYAAIRPRVPERAATLPDALAAYALRDPDDRVDVDSLHAALGYRAEFGDFYDLLLERLTDQDLLAVHLPDGASGVGPVWADFAEIRVHRLRTRGRMGEATALLDQVAEVRGEQSRSLYERGYLHFLHGRVDDALDALTDSIEAAHLAGNEVGAWISTLVRDQIAFYDARIDPATYADVLDRALAFFTARSTGAHADRWLMNVHNQILTMGYLAGDAALTARERDILRNDEWTARERPWLVHLWEARAAVTAGDWALALDRYESILGDDALTGPPPDVEGIAWNLLDYGRALAGLGRHPEARTAWHQVLRCADSTAAWPWKPRAQSLLNPTDPSEPMR